MMKQIDFIALCQKLGKLRTVIKRTSSPKPIVRAIAKYKDTCTKRLKCPRFIFDFENFQVNRQFKRPTRFGIRRHTRDGNSQTMYGGQQTMRSSLRGSFREENTDSVRGAESIRLNTIQPKEIEVSVLDVNSNGKAKSV